jgi:hypothetical protein
MPDIRYKTINLLLKEGLILTWSDLFKYIPYTVVAKALRMNNNRMKAINANTGALSVEEIHIIAGLIKCDPAVIFNLALTGMDGTKRKRARNVKKKG